MDLFGLTSDRVMRRIHENGARNSIPSLGRSLLIGSFGFCLASLCVFATVAFAERWMYRNLGLGGAYLVWTVLFIIDGACHRLGFRRCKNFLRADCRAVYRQFRRIFSRRPAQQLDPWKDRDVAMGCCVWVVSGSRFRIVDISCPVSIARTAQ